ncbi:MAG: MFS transporter, partial [Clostridiales bacterium]|nr:MFS transporter [Clostridiales bacterium]
NILSILVAVSSALQMYFAVDLMGHIRYKMLILIATIPAFLFAGLFVPKLIEILGEHTNFKLLYISCCLVAAVIHILTFITTKSALMRKADGAEISVSIAIYIITLMALAALPMESRKILSKEMEAQTVDYVEWIYGKRLEGTMLSIMSLSEKIVTIFGSALALFILGFSNYATHENYASVPQTSQAKLTLLICSTIVPMAGYLLMIIPMLFYDISGDEHGRMLLDVKRRNVKGNYIKRSTVTDLFADMSEEDIAKLTAMPPEIYKIQNLGVATLEAKALYNYAIEEEKLDESFKFEMNPNAVEEQDETVNYIIETAFSSLDTDENDGTQENLEEKSEISIDEAPSENQEDASNTVEQTENTEQ